MKDLLETATKEAAKKNSINQNVIMTMAFYVGAAFAGMHIEELEILYYVSLIMFILGAVSVLLSLVAYTYNYCKKKIKDL